MSFGAQFLAYILPVYLCVAVGIVWRKAGGRFDAPLVAALVGNIGFPCLILAAFDRVAIGPAMLFAFLIAAVFVIGALATTAAVIRRIPNDGALAPADRLIPGPVAAALLVSLLAFGDLGLAFSLIVFSLARICDVLLGGGAGQPSRSSLGRLLRAPVAYALLIALALELAQIGLPRFALNTVSLLGAAAIPAELIALGVHLARARIAGSAAAYAVSGARLGIGVAAALGAAFLLGLDAPARAALVFVGAMPFAFDARGLGTVSHVLALAVLPILLLLIGMA